MKKLLLLYLACVLSLSACEKNTADAGEETGYRQISQAEAAEMITPIRSRNLRKRRKAEMTWKRFCSRQRNR